jgi:chitin synthase
MGILSAVLIVQVALSLVYVCRRRRTIDREQTRSKVIVMVPCYNEGAKELKKTIDSVMDTSYPDANKVLIVVADGNITGKGETSSTPETLRELLGFKMTPKDKSYECESLGKNRAKLYYGTKTDCNKSLKYLVIVKSGLETEQGSARAGNRGKRDSQLLLIGLLNRVHHRRKLNALDKAIVAVLKKLSVAIDTVKYLMTIDADTRVEAESISHMTYTMNKDKKILALCGETRIDNKGKSW